MKEDILLAILFTSLAAMMFAFAYRINLDKGVIEQQALIISGQQATIASYKENLTSCLKEHKMSTQDEFTGE